MSNLHIRIIKKVLSIASQGSISLRAMIYVLPNLPSEVFPTRSNVSAILFASLSPLSLDPSIPCNSFSCLALLSQPSTLFIRFLLPPYVSLCRPLLISCLCFILFPSLVMLSGLFSFISALSFTCHASRVSYNSLCLPCPLSTRHTLQLLSSTLPLLFHPLASSSAYL